MFGVKDERPEDEGCLAEFRTIMTADESDVDDDTADLKGWLMSC